MMQQRNGEGRDPRPLSARSVVASTLLGMDPPRLSARLLVRSGELFGITAGTTRVALSRMVMAGELEPDDGGYRLAGHLLERQARQASSRAAARLVWEGDWSMAVVIDGRRAAADRSALRQAMRALRLAEDREGVWLRPANLDPGRAPAASGVVTAQCRSYRSCPDQESAAQLAGRLWDLRAWAWEAGRLVRAMDRLVRPLERGETDALAPGFELSATVLRHLLADPLLPVELLAPGWPGDRLRADYERYDQAFKTVWRDWFREQPVDGGR